MILDTPAASADETETPDATETPVLQATDDTTTETPVVATDSTDGDDEDVKSDSDDGKLDVETVNKIVKGRVERARVKIREEVQNKANEEIEFWQSKAKEQKQIAPILNLPPEPKMSDYASNPTQYAEDLKTWSSIKSSNDAYFRNIVTTYQGRAIEFAKDKPDFDKSCQVFNSLTVTPALEQTVLESEYGPALSYYLSKNLKEFDRINKLSNNSIARELGKLELKLTGELVEVKPVVKTKVVPKPTTPISGGSAPASKNPATQVKTEAGRLAFLEERKAVHRKGNLSR
jgi:hypothetical protein